MKNKLIFIIGIIGMISGFTAIFYPSLGLALLAILTGILCLFYSKKEMGIHNIILGILASAIIFI